MAKSPLQSPPPEYDIRWMFLLWQKVSAVGGTAWESISKVGSKLTDIESRKHSDLTDLNGANYSHLTAAQLTELTGGQETALHTHTGESNHNYLDGLQGGIAANVVNAIAPEFYHLSSAQKTDLTDAGATILHKHDHALQDNLNSANYTHLTAANHTDLTDAGATLLHKHDHALQDNLNSTNYTHLTAANHTDLTDAGATILHKHDHALQDNINSANYTHLTAANHIDLTDAGDSALHFHSTDRDSANFTGANWTDLTDSGATLLHKHDHALQDNLNSTNYTHLTATNHTDLTDGGITSLHKHNASDVNLVADTGLTHTIQDLQNYGNSAGVVYAVGGVDGIVTVSATAGAVDVAAFSAYFRTSASAVAPLKYYDLAATTALAIPSNTARWILASYNAGAPVVTISASDTSDGLQVLTLAYAVNLSGAIHMILFVQDRFNDHTHNINQRNWEVNGVQRASGAALGQPANLKLSVTDAIYWSKASRIVTPGMDSSVPSGANSGTFWTYYYTGAAWVETASLTALAVTQYNNIASGLVTMTSTRWGYYDAYLGVGDGDLRILYGQAQYLTLADAEVAPISSILPVQISEPIYQLIGRVIFQESAASFAAILSAYKSLFNTVGIVNHNSLSGLQGGTVNEYYHLTVANHTGLTGGGDSALHFHSADRNSANFTGVNWTDLTDSGATTLHKHDHNAQDGKQGGTVNEYYHLTAAEYAALGGAGITLATTRAVSSLRV